MEAATRPINSHDPEPKPTPADKLQRQIIMAPGRAPKLVYVLNGSYAGEIGYTAMNHDILAAMGKDFAAYTQELCDAHSKRVASAPANALDLLKGARR